MNGLLSNMRATHLRTMSINENVGTTTNANGTTIRIYPKTRMKFPLCFSPEFYRHCSFDDQKFICSKRRSTFGVVYRIDSNLEKKIEFCAVFYFASHIKLVSLSRFVHQKNEVDLRYSSKTKFSSLETKLLKRKVPDILFSSELDILSSFGKKSICFARDQKTQNQRM